MSFQAQIRFLENDEVYLTVQTHPEEPSFDMVLDVIFSSLALLIMGDHKFDDEIVDRLIRRVEEIRIEYSCQD